MRQYKQRLNSLKQAIGADVDSWDSIPIEELQRELAKLETWELEAIAADSPEQLAKAEKFFRSFLSYMPESEWQRQKQEIIDRAERSRRISVAIMKGGGTFWDS